MRVLAATTLAVLAFGHAPAMANKPQSLLDKLKTPRLTAAQISTGPTKKADISCNVHEEMVSIVARDDQGRISFQPDDSHSYKTQTGKRTALRRSLR